MRPTKVIVHLDNIADNVRLIISRLTPVTQLMAVVKANGYGHGAVAVAKTVLTAGAVWLGVAMAEEGVALREAGITAPILILGQSWEGQIAQAIEHNIDLTVFDMATFDQIAREAARLRKEAWVHIKIDTGMGRVGMPISEWNDEWWHRLNHTPMVKWRGLMTHFAESDAEDSTFTRRQLQNFLDMIESIRRRGSLPSLIHAANSCATLKYPGTHFNLVRVGIALYGGIDDPELKPGLSWESRVVYLKDVPEGMSIGYGRTYRTVEAMKIAAVPVGYADGYRRQWSNLASVIIEGHCYPVVGRISMDQISVGLPLSAPVRVGDRVTLLGSDGTCTIRATDLAELAQSISYEILTGIGSRVVREWV